MAFRMTFPGPNRSQGGLPKYPLPESRESDPCRPQELNVR